MAENPAVEPVPTKSLGEKLQSINKSVLFLILIICTSVPLFFTGLKVPNDPEKSTMDLYNAIQKVPEGSTILVESDWTNSTHGESGGQFKALIRLMSRKKIKACIYTAADPQAPKVSRDTMRSMNDEFDKAGIKYKEWEDWVNLGYFPSAEATTVSMASNIRKAFAGKKALSSETKAQTDVFESPVLKNIHSVDDCAMLIVLTASNTSNIVIERLSGRKLKLGMMVTGVMGPETQVYYDSHQLMGLSKGLKGVYDMETAMEKDFPGQVNLDQGALYYPTLHVALFLLIITVIIGNVGMAMGRRAKAE